MSSASASTDVQGSITDRPLVRPFDESQLPPIRTDAANPLPWPALAATKRDAEGKPTFLKYVDGLDGKTVSLTGFMQPLRDELELTSFLLVEYPVGCWFCESPEVTGMINVEMKTGRKGELKKGLIRVEGKLEYDPAKMKFTNNAEANKYLTPAVRKGWSIG